MGQPKPASLSINTAGVPAGLFRCEKRGLLFLRLRRVKPPARRPAVLWTPLCSSRFRRSGSFGQAEWPLLTSALRGTCLKNIQARTTNRQGVNGGAASANRRLSPAKVRASDP
jgi:hypothetical protein